MPDTTHEMSWGRLSLIGGSLRLEEPDGATFRGRLALGVAIDRREIFSVVTEVG